MMKCDFAGWATRNDLVCSDGRTIIRDAFKGNDGSKVPLVWNHDHSDPTRVLGHALLENRNEGVYAYCSFNDSEQAKAAKEAVIHGDVNSLSIYANKLKQDSRKNVYHGVIREVSLVMAGANPGAFIDTVMCHGEDGDDEFLSAGWNENIVIYQSSNDVIEHADNSDTTKNENTKEDKAMADKDKTIGEVFDAFTEEQKNVVYALIGIALENAKEEEDNNMKHSIFDQDLQTMDSTTLSHAETEVIFNDAKKKRGSLKDSFLAHAEEYGIENIDFLFPEDHNLDVNPQVISRDMGWVSKFMGLVNHTPFSKIRSTFADITEDQARAKGYIKGTLKKEEVFSLLKRRTEPTTVYKKQKLDKDDIEDIKNMDIVARIKVEMRTLLNEEIARAGLLGDGRLSSDDDKIDENHIRPIANDASLFVIRWGVADGSDAKEKIKNFMYAAIKSRKNYKGTGKPILFTYEDWLTDMLLLEDSLGYKIYKTETELATALRVSEIVTVPEMENYTDADGKKVYGIIVNPKDYTFGANNGGDIDMFDDFDIDFNQYKYLMETRCSGALTKPFSAIVLRAALTTASEEPTMQEAMAPYKQ